MEPTIFDKIIAKEIPAEIIYEDDQVVAFLDNQPINPGHTLVVPRQGFVNILDGDPDTLAHMMRMAQVIAQTVCAATQAEGVNVYMNNGAVAGQEVFYCHLHVVPRHKDDGRFSPPVRSGEAESVKLAKTLRDNLSTV